MNQSTRALFVYFVLGLSLIACKSSDTSKDAGGTQTDGGAGKGAGSDAGPKLAEEPLSGIPCSVGAVVAKRCFECHGETLKATPMHLQTRDDFLADAVVTKGKKVYEVAHSRIHSAKTPMPPGAMLAADELKTLDDWLTAGAPAGDKNEVCDKPKPIDQVSGECPPDQPKAGEGLTATAEETCYEFKTHGGQTLDDTTKFTVRGADASGTPGQFYEQFYFEVPWETGSVSTRFGSKLDNVPILHHWLFFSTNAANEPGTHIETLGSQAGSDAGALIAGWALGGCDVRWPADVGGELPAKGTKVHVQWHYYNATGKPQEDGSTVQVCTVPKGSRKNVASVTWLGTEQLGSGLPLIGPGMPPGKSDWHGTCLNDSKAPIHIVQLWPHMHKLGRNMKSVVMRAKTGMEETVFDRPFDFNKQVVYPVDVTLEPGDSITSTCSFDNDTGKGVPFGPKSEQEMCYQFAYSYPARALDNGVFSYIGATNTCW